MDDENVLNYLLSRGVAPQVVEVIRAMLGSYVPASTQLLTTEEAAKFCGYSTSRWRYLYAAGLAPQPIHLSARKNGWRASELAAWIQSKQEAGRH